MPITQQRKVYADWSGGHWGTNGPFKAEDNQYRAVNVQRYANGTVGPRPGWKLIATTGSAPAPVAGAGSEMYGLVWVQGTAGDGGYLVFVSYADATATKRLDMDTLVWSDAALDAPVNDMQLGVTNGGSLVVYAANLVLVGGQKYYDASANTVGTISFPASFSPRASVVYKARLYCWGDSTFPGRVYVSNANNFSGFATGSYFDIGINRTVMGAWNIGDSLLFLTLAGAINGLQSEAEWWLLTGANPVVGSLRFITRDVWPGAPSHATVFKENLIFQDSFYDHGIMAHDGESLNTTGLRRFTSRSGNHAVGGSSRSGVSLVGEPAMALAYVIGSSQADPTAPVIGEHYDNGVQAWEFVNGAWTKASYWNGAVASANGASSFLWGVAGWEGNKIIACTNTSTDGSGEFKFYKRLLTYNRLTSTSETHSDPGEPHADVTGQDGASAIPNILWLPAIQSPLGAGVRVRRVIVDVEYWKNTACLPASTADLECSIGSYRLEDGDFAESEYQRSDSGPLASTDAIVHPKQARIVFEFDGDGPFVSAAQVRFRNLRNLAIDRVTVDYDQNTKDVQ